MMVMDVGPRAHGSVRKGFSGAQKYGGGDGVQMVLPVV